MILATTTGDLEPYFPTKAEAVRAFGRTPFRHLDMNFYDDFHPNSYLMGPDYLSEPLRALDAAKELGIDFVQAHAPNINTASCDEADAIRAMERCFEICARLGIPNLVTHTSYSLDIPYPDGEKEYFETNRAYMRKLFPAMEKYGVRFLVENSTQLNMRGMYFFMTADELNRFIDFCGHPLVSACWDVGHANMEKADQRREIAALGNHLRAVHMQDNLGSADIHIAPMTGATDFDGVMRGLMDIGFPGPFTFEASNLLPYRGRRAFAPEDRLRHPSPDSAVCAENLLYSIGRDILTAYDCFEA